jgi:hypothetical protein
MAKASWEGYKEGNVEEKYLGQCYVEKDIPV